MVDSEAYADMGLKPPVLSRVPVKTDAPVTRLTTLQLWRAPAGARGYHYERSPQLEDPWALTEAILSMFDSTRRKSVETYRFRRG